MESNNELYKKEYYQFRSDPVHNFHFQPDNLEDILSANHLKLHSYQMFVRNFMSPYTGNKSLYIKHGTGTGKTLTAIAVAQEFIKIFREIHLEGKSLSVKKDTRLVEKNTPSVFVIGSGGTKHAFYRDLIRYPEFGFITVGEKEEMNRKYVDMRLSGSEESKKIYGDYYMKIVRRLTTKLKGGFYKFYGYDKFVNLLFSSHSKLAQIEIDITNRIKAGEKLLLEDEIYRLIGTGELVLNKDLIAQFEGSLLICDEIHNTYNTVTKNDRGLAVQILLDTVENIKVLMLSATPVNNSATEIVNLINYFYPRREGRTAEESGQIRKDELFTNGELRSGARERIANMMKDKISFLQDVNIKLFPSWDFEGRALAVDGKELDYLKFIECKMSDLHTDAYHRLLTERNIAIEDAGEDAEVEGDEPDKTIPSDGYSMYDIVLPSPSGRGIYRTSEIKSELLGASREWKDSVGLEVNRSVSGQTLFSGRMFELEALRKYSSKYAKLVESVVGVMSGFSGRGQKIMIYHNRVYMSGVVMIAEILRTNGFIDDSMDATDNTRCAMCGVTRAQHGSATEHIYSPARFLIVHSDIDKLVMSESLVKFSAQENNHGAQYLILIGSKIIKESYDIKDVRHLFVLSLPINVPTLLQLMGRCIRKNSHASLPIADRHVSVYIMISTLDRGEIAPEVQKWRAKLDDYIVIQDVEQVLNEVAVDANINRDIIAKSMTNNGRRVFGNLYFEPRAKLEYVDVDKIDTRTFYRWNEEEVRTIIYLLKRLFMLQPVWKFDDLWTSVLAPPFNLESNPKLFSKNNFIVALHKLLQDNTGFINRKNYRGAERVYDWSDIYISVDGLDHRIVHVGEWFICVPIHTTDRLPLVDVDSYWRRDTKVKMLKISYLNMNNSGSSAQDTAFEKFKTEYDPADPHLLFKFSDVDQVQIVTSIIEELWLDVNIYKSLLELLVSLGALIIFSALDLSKIADVYSPKLSGNIVCGFYLKNSAKLYDGSKWLTVSKFSIGKNTVYKDAVYVGYFGMISGVSTFKIRPAANDIQSDGRKIQKGISCLTRSKQDLVEIRRELGMKTNSELRVKSVCDDIMHNMLAKEIRERQRNSKVKWFYGFWDTY